VVSEGLGADYLPICGYSIAIKREEVISQIIHDSEHTFLIKQQNIRKSFPSCVNKKSKNKNMLHWGKFEKLWMI